MNAGLEPFLAAQGEAFYFVTPALRQRIDLVGHLVEFGRQIILLTGPPGAGKSTLLERVIEPMEKKGCVLRFDAGPTMSRSALLTRIARELDPNAPDGDDEVLIDTIRRRVKAASQRGETTVLAIDDAHTLPVDVHVCLARLAHTVGEAAEMKMVLSADLAYSPLIDRLQGETSQHRLVHIVEIPRLDEEQTRSMLAHRWGACNGNDKIPLSPTQISRIYRQSNGNPGKVLVLARQVWCLTGSPQPLVRDPAQRYLIGGGAMIVVLLLFAFFYADDLKDRPQTSIDIELPPLTVPKTVPPTVTRAQSAPLSHPLSGVPDTEQANTATPAAESVRLDPPSDLPPPMAMPPPTEDRPPSGETVMPLPPTQPAVRQPSVAPVVQPEPTIPDITSAPVGLAGSPKPEAVHPVDKPEVSVRYSIDWLRTQSASGYVLQLFAVRNRQTAIAYIETWQIGDKSTVITSTHEGAPWYAVIYGNYPDRVAAMAAIADLPAGLAATKPWVRSIASLE